MDGLTIFKDVGCRVKYALISFISNLDFNIAIIFRERIWNKPETENFTLLFLYSNVSFSLSQNCFIQSLLAVSQLKMWYIVERC